MNIDVKGNKLKNKIRLPHLGQRILKTAFAVFLCLIIYMIRGYEGLVTQSTVAAIICIQPYRSDVISTSANRIIGTLVGAAWALLFLISMDFLNHHGITIPMVPVYMIMSAGIVATLYSTVLLKKTDAASLAAIVFICIVAAYPELETPFLLTLHRIIDTLIGIIVAGAVNSMSLPRRKHYEYVFFLRLQDLVPDRFSHVSSNVLVMLNRLYNEGAQICLISKWAPAFLLSQMGIMNVNLPVIVMDGAALYDIHNRRYMEVIALSAADEYFLRDVFQTIDHGYSIYAVRESSLMIYRRAPHNWAEVEDYELMKRSPYRNYIDGDFVAEDKITFIRLIDTDQKIDEIERILKVLIPPGRFRMVRRPQPKIEGCSGLYFYHPDANVEHMKEILLDRIRHYSPEEIIPVDVMLKEKYTSDNEAIALLNRTRSIFEPVRVPWEK